jgi:phage terminase small subunit
MGKKKTTKKAGKRRANKKAKAQPATPTEQSSPEPKRKAGERSCATNPYGLTDLQWRFVQEYPLNDFNATKTAVAAGYKGKGAQQWGSLTLKNHRVREAIQDMLEERTKYYEVSRDRVIQEWMSIGFFNLQDITEGNGPAGMRWKDMSKLPRQVTAAIESVDHKINSKGDIVMGIKTAKIQGLTMLTKMLGLLEPAQKDDGKGAFMRWLEEQERQEERDIERELAAEEKAREQAEEKRRILETELDATTPIPDELPDE